MPRDDGGKQNGRFEKNGGSQKSFAIGRNDENSHDSEQRAKKRTGGLNKQSCRILLLKSGPRQAKRRKANTCGSGGWQQKKGKPSGRPATR